MKIYHAIIWFICFLSLPLQADEWSESDRAKSYTYRILSVDKRLGTGTGFLVNNKGHIVTNAHVADQDTKKVFVIQLGESGVEVWTAEHYSSDSFHDLSIFTVEGLIGKPHCQFREKDISETQKVYAVGYPGLADEDEEVRSFYQALAAKIKKDPDANYYKLPRSSSFLNFANPTITTGSIQSIRQTPWGVNSKLGGSSLPNKKCIQHNAEISGGNSGGPLVGDDGQVVGVNTKGKWETRGLGKIRSSLHFDEIVHYLDQNSIPYNTGSGFSLGFFSWVEWLAVVLILGAVGVLVWILLGSKKEEAIAGGGSAPVPVPTRDGGRGNVRCRLSGKDSEGSEVTLEITGQHLAQAQGCVIGRGSDAVLRIFDNTISRKHIKIKQGSNGRSLYVSDAGSSNGTYYNGKKLEPKTGATLAIGGVIKLGEITLKIIHLA